MNTRILQTMVSGIPLVLGLRMKDPYLSSVLYTIPYYTIIMTDHTVTYHIVSILYHLKRILMSMVTTIL